MCHVIYFLGLLQLRFECAKFHYGRISLTNFMEGGLFYHHSPPPPPPIRDQPRKGTSWIGLRCLFLNIRDIWACIRDCIFKNQKTGVKTVFCNCFCIFFCCLISDISSRLINMEILLNQVVSTYYSLYWMSLFRPSWKKIYKRFKSQFTCS